MEAFAAPQLALVLRGVKWSLGIQARASRLPITVDVLRLLVSSLPQTCESRFECLLFQAMFCTAFFGFFRIGEITSASEEPVTLGDVRMEGDQLVLRLCCSKTDPYHRGCDVVIGSSGTSLCAVSAVQKYLAYRGKKLGTPQATAPLFAGPSGEPVSWEQLAKVLKASVKAAGIADAEQYSGHSFRIGAATTAGQQGVPGVVNSGGWALEQRLFQSLCADCPGATATAGPPNVSVTLVYCACSFMRFSCCGTDAALPVRLKQHTCRHAIVTVFCFVFAYLLASNYAHSPDTMTCHVNSPDGLH